MVGWSHLPPEIKQYVVKKLDFMSRHSSKCTSYTDRQIVNSTPLNIPRVRFCHKGGRCLIVIYTGIEQFLRWELFDEDDGVILEKCENCYDTDGFRRILIGNVRSLQMGIHALKNLLAHESIKIDVFEWDIPCEMDDGHPKNMCEIIRCLNGVKFRATEVLATPFSHGKPLLTYANRICSDVKKLNMMHWDHSDSNIIPREIIEYITVTHDETCAATFVLYKPNDRVDVSSEYLFELGKQLLKTAVCCTIEKVLGANKIPAPQIQRSEENGLIKLTYTTKCGKYIIKTLPKDEQFFRNQLDNMKCGMSWLCKKCADPFEYWYYQNLTMRLVHEPFWALDETDEPSTQLMKLLKKKVNQLPKPFKSSWGFKKIPTKLQTTDEPSQNAQKDQKMKKEVKINRRKELQERWKKTEVKKGNTTRIPKFFIWFGISIVGYIAFSVVLNLIM